MSIKTHEVLPSGVKVDRNWWYLTKQLIAIAVGAVAAILVASLV